MIYIDPPYNTGKDFIYKDDFNDNIKNYKEMMNESCKTNTDTTGRLHTNWLNMMYPRLRLAKNLLTDEGVIFISIDDNEVVNLKKICDEIFGEVNFVALTSVIVKTEGRRYGFFAKTHEQILVYSKKQDELKLNEIEIEGKDFSYTDEFGGFNIKDLRNQNARAFNETNRPNLRYPFYVDTKNIDEDGFCKISTELKDGYAEVYPIVVNDCKSVWRWGKEKSTKEINDLTARKGTDGVVRVFQKYRKLTQTPKTVWFEKEFISNKGTKEMQDIIGSGIFDFSKPINLIKRLLEIGSDKDSIVLDFFSGSCTTAHAVMKLNAEDGGNRKFIMVQIPEVTDEKSEAYKSGYKNICEIGKERIRIAGKKILEENKDKEGIEDLDTGFKVFKLDTTNIKEWDDTIQDTEEIKQMTMALDNPIKDGRSQEDVIYEILLKYGVDLTMPIEEIEIMGSKVYSVGFGYLMICLEEDISLDLIEAIGEQKPNRVVLYDNGLDNESKTNGERILKEFGVKDIRTI